MDEICRGVLEINFSFDVRIAYADTDRMGVVYYANYLTLFERGRTELMRNLDLRYRDLEDNHHVYLPVMDASCKYLHPARYDDLIRVVTYVHKLGPASIDFRYEIFDVASQRKLAEGFTRHPFVNKDWKPVRVPPFLREKLTPTQ
jgi:acyl-CoA thioester hydrolase